VGQLRLRNELLGCASSRPHRQNDPRRVFATVEDNLVRGVPLGVGRHRVARVLVGRNVGVGAAGQVDANPVSRLEGMRDVAQIDLVARDLAGFQKLFAFKPVAIAGAHHARDRPELDRPAVRVHVHDVRDEVGVATGMVWTQIGGDIVSVEATTMPGEGKLSMTGQLQEVMRESVQAAVAYIRSRSESFALSDKQFEQQDIHIHIPEGAVPKDGPSAGITVATAIISALTGKFVRKDIAMTGEITLRGRVLPIGGLKEKALAAYRNGIFDIIIPVDNEKDEVDIPTEIRDGIRFHKVNDMMEVLELALTEPIVDPEVPVEMSVASKPPM